MNTKFLKECLSSIPQLIAIPVVAILFGLQLFFLFDSVKFFDRPTFIIAMSVLNILSLVCVILYVNGKHKFDDKYWLRIAVVAEVLAVAGIVGIGTFLGTALLQEDANNARKAIEVAEQKLANHVSRQVAVCNARYFGRKATFISSPDFQFCELIVSNAGTYRPDIDLIKMRGQVQKYILMFAKDIQLHPDAALIPFDIDNIFLNKARLEQNQWRDASKFKEGVSNYLVLLYCAVLISISLKIARSIRELKKKEAG